ncbi:DUF695 domain-containing protein [Psychroflexus torquis]|nr:DUF695 domain-containing protein [Psychroflexus torquis]
MVKDKDFRVIIPKQQYQVLNFNTDGLPGIAVVNKSLSEFKPKEVFVWHCSVMVQCEKLIENGMPSREEVEILDKFGDFLDDKIKGADKKKPNGLFLARITGNKTRELIWRIFNPVITNDFLTDLIEREDHIRNFDYRIDEDEDWKLTEWHLKKRK